MSWNDEVDRAFAERRAALLAELLTEGAALGDDAGAVVEALAAGHPVVHVGLGLAIGAAAGHSVGSGRRADRGGAWRLLVLPLLRGIKALVTPAAAILPRSRNGAPA